MKLAKGTRANLTDHFHSDSRITAATQGALSIMGSRYWQQAFRPFTGYPAAGYNSFDDLALITDRTACVVAETIQAKPTSIPTKRLADSLAA